MRQHADRLRGVRGLVNFEKARDAINDRGYAGWIQIEGGPPPNAELVASYTANLKFLRGLFPA
jgi:sugar phosphate isomerase/epimerase